MDLIRRIRPEKTGVRAPLGDLEMAVMREIWPCGCDGRLAIDVLKALGAKRSLALTTVLTTLDRLKDKGILTREREGKAYRYRAALSEAELQQRIVSGVLGELIAQFPQAVAAYFVEQVPEQAAEKGEQAALLALSERLADFRSAQAKQVSTSEGIEGE